MRIQRRAARYAFFGALAAVVMTPAAAQACNPIQFLFGGCRPQAPAYIEREEAPVAPVRKKEKKPVVSESGGVSHRQTAIKAPPGVSVGSLAHFSEDATLRNGDVVVTPKGFLIYRGGRTEGLRSASAFTPLGSGRVELTTLEKASRVRTAGEWTAKSLAVSPTQQNLVKEVRHHNAADGAVD